MGNVITAHRGAGRSPIVYKNLNPVFFNSFNGASDFVTKFDVTTGGDEMDFRRVDNLNKWKVRISPVSGNYSLIEVNAGTSFVRGSSAGGGLNSRITICAFGDTITIKRNDVFEFSYVSTFNQTATLIYYNNWGSQQITNWYVYLVSSCSQSGNLP